MPNVLTIIQVSGIHLCIINYETKSKFMLLISPQKMKSTAAENYKDSFLMQNLTFGTISGQIKYPSFQWSKYSLLIWGIDAQNLPLFPRFTPGFHFLFKIFYLIAKSSSIRLAQTRLLGSCDCYR